MRRVRQCKTVGVIQHVREVVRLPVIPWEVSDTSWPAGLYRAAGNVAIPLRRGYSDGYGVLRGRGTHEPCTCGDGGRLDPTTRPRGATAIAGLGDRECLVLDGLWRKGR